FKGEGFTDKVSWHPSIDGLRKGLYGCIMSNEFFDALPVHVITKRGDRFFEVYVAWDGEGFVELLGEPSTPRLLEYLDAVDVSLVDGQRVEVNLNALEFIERMGLKLDKGFVVTIDYGLMAKELYSPHRNGSLMCYYRHTMGDNPYQRVGYQDVTTHVDFTGLARWGYKGGLEVTGLTNQLYFLLGLGVLNEFQPLEDISLENLSLLKWNQDLKELIIPGGMGGTFKVLIQHKGVERPELLGLSIKNFKPLL
ncbi:MAG: SAM-dependent methyltransferase, partial [Deltaproteobacteria bacterium]|nr:SAM-dependent methyltransferase [Deltaproteobacteria bacterium]